MILVKSFGKDEDRPSKELSSYHLFDDKAFMNK